jgi:hypothetical protein
MVDGHPRSGPGYPTSPASDDELDEKFLACAGRALTAPSAARALELLRTIEELEDIRTLTGVLGDTR